MELWTYPNSPLIGILSTNLHIISGWNLWTTHPRSQRGSLIRTIRYSEVHPSRRKGPAGWLLFLTTTHEDEQQQKTCKKRFNISSPCALSRRKRGTTLERVWLDGMGCALDGCPASQPHIPTHPQLESDKFSFHYLRTVALIFYHPLNLIYKIQ